MKNIDDEINKLLQIKAEISYLAHMREKYPDFVFMSQISYMQLPSMVRESDLTFYIIPLATLGYIEEDKVFVTELGDIKVIKG